MVAMMPNIVYSTVQLATDSDSPAHDAHVNRSVVGSIPTCWSFFIVLLTCCLPQSQQCFNSESIRYFSHFMPFAGASLQS